MFTVLYIYIRSINNQLNDFQQEASDSIKKYKDLKLNNKYSE